MSMTLHVHVQREGRVLLVLAVGVVVRRLENDVSILLLVVPRVRRRKEKKLGALSMLDR